MDPVTTDSNPTPRSASDLRRILVALLPMQGGDQARLALSELDAPGERSARRGWILSRFVCKGQLDGIRRCEELGLPHSYDPEAVAIWTSLGVLVDGLPARRKGDQ